MEEKKLTNVQAIKAFFDVPPVSMAELKALTAEEREWLGDECRKVLAA